MPRKNWRILIQAMNPEEHEDDQGIKFCPHLDIRSSDPRQICFVSSPMSTSSAEESPSSGREAPETNDSIPKETNCTQIEPKKLKRKLPRVCSSCKVQDKNGKMIPYWRCLESKCGAVLCGASGDNHADEHFKENPDHPVQENISSRRLWCSICEFEVYRDTTNRRRSPGVWIPDNLEDFLNSPPRGLCNIGNTCFMNAALQNIVAVDPLTSYLIGVNCNLVGKHVAGSYRWLVSELISEPYQRHSGGVTPSRLLHAVRASHPIFRGFQQHDSQEFLRLFMDSLSNDTKVPHFIIHEEEVKKNESENGKAFGSEILNMESDTESYATCDSGNGSEEAVQVEDRQNGEDPAKDSSGKHTVKVVMKSCLSDIFEGEIESSVQCLACKQTSRRVETFQDLSLPIPTKDELSTLTYNERFDEHERASSSWVAWFLEWIKNYFWWGPSPSLDHCFKAFFSSDELKGKNMYFCEKCGKLRNGIKRCSLYRLPEVLCMHLKRFRMYEYTGGMGYSGKISQYVQFPEDGLDVRSFTHSDCQDKVSEYRLTGVIVHMGSVLGGHYTAYIRRGDLWFLADDSNIQFTTWETVAECEAYVLFYRKQPPESEYGDSIGYQSEIIKIWDAIDKGQLKETRYHLVSRKWLTKLYWCEEETPLDNSDVVCPHGFLVPTEDINLRATWVPHQVWEMIMERYGGGPDWVQAGECAVCTAVWKKFQKAAQKAAASAGRKPSICESVRQIYSSPSPPSIPINMFYKSKRDSYEPDSELDPLVEKLKSQFDNQRSPQSNGPTPVIHTNSQI